MSSNSLVIKMIEEEEQKEKEKEIKEKEELIQQIKQLRLVPGNIGEYTLDELKEIAGYLINTPFHKEVNELPMGEYFSELSDYKADYKQESIEEYYNGNIPYIIVGSCSKDSHENQSNISKEPVRKYFHIKSRFNRKCKNK